MADMMIGYVLLFLFIAIVFFCLGCEWKSIEYEEKEEQKGREPIRRVPGRWE